MIDVSIVIVTWNARDVVHQCLSSIQDASSEISTEVLVVDNASSDDTPAMVQDEFPHSKLIRNESNVGFARANNIGVRLATGRYVCLINSDVTVPAGCIETLVDFMDDNPSVGIAGPRMLTPDGSAGPSCMRRPTLCIWLLHALGLASVFKNASLHIQKLASAPEDVDVLNGWFWIVRTAALDQVGLLDETFFMYGEDIDWCHRFWDAGWRVVYCSTAEATHYGGASSARAPVRYYIEMQRANLQYWKRYHRLPSQIAYVSIVILHHFLRVLGYSVVYALKPQSRSDVRFKIMRSSTCLRWLLGLSRQQGAFRG